MILVLLHLNYDILCVSKLLMLPDQVVTCEESNTLVRTYKCHFNVPLMSYICLKLYYTLHILR